MYFWNREEKMANRMDFMKATIVLLFLSVLLVSCTTPSPTLTATSIPFPTPTRSSTSTITPATPQPSSTAPRQTSPSPTFTLSEPIELGLGTANDAIWSPNGKLFVIAGSAGAHVYDAITFQELSRIEIGDISDQTTMDLAITPQKIAFSPNSQTIAMGGYGGFQINDLKSGRLLASGYADIVPGLAFTPDGSALAVLTTGCGRSCSSSIQLLDPQDGSLIRYMGDQWLMETLSLAVSPDGQWLAAGDVNNQVHIWKIATGELVFVLEGHADYVTDVAFSPDGSLLISAGADGSLRFWDPLTGQLLHTYWGFTDGLSQVLFHPDGRRLLVKVVDAPYQVWDIQAGSRVDELGIEPGDLLNFSPDGSRLASKIGQAIQVWDAAIYQPLHSFEDYRALAEAIEFSPDGRSLAAAGNSGIQTLDTATGQWGKAFPMWYATHLAYSRSGDLLAASNDNQEVIVWNVRTGELLITLDVDSTTSLAFSPDETLIAIGSKDVVNLWDIQNARQATTLASQGGEVIALEFSTDGQQLTSASKDENSTFLIQVWEVSSGKLLKSFDVLQKNERGWETIDLLDHTLARMSNYTPNTMGVTIELWDTSSGQLLRSFAGPEWYSGRIVLSPDGRLLAVQSYENLAIFDALTGQQLATWSENNLSNLVFSSNGLALAVLKGDSTIKLFDLTSMAQAVALLLTPPPSEPSQTPALPRSTPSSTATATLIVPITPVIPPSPQPGAITAANLSDVTQLALFGKGTVEQATWLPDGGSFAIASSQGIYLYDAHSLAEIAHLDTGEWMENLAFSRDGQLMVTKSSSGTVQVWDMQARQPLYSFQGNSGGYGLPAISPDGQWIAFATDHDQYQVINLPDNKVLANLSGFGTSNPLFSPDGRQLALGLSDGSVRIWDAASGQIVNGLGGPRGRITGIAFSSDGDRLAAAASTGDVWLWDLATGKALLEITIFLSEEPVFPDPYHRITCVAFSPDGQTLAAGAADGQIRLIDAATGEILASLDGHGGAVTGVAFKPNGGVLLSTDTYSTLKIWDVATRKLLPSIEAHGRRMGGLLFQEDGRLLTWRDDTVWEENPGSNPWLRVSRVYTGTILAASHDGEWLAIYNNLQPHDLHMELWETNGAEPLFELEGEPETWGIGAWDVTGFFVAAFSPDNRLLAAAGSGGLWIWDTQTGNPMKKLLGGFAGIPVILKLEFSPGGRLCAAYDTRQILQVWNTDTGQLVREFHNISAEQFTFSPSGLWLVAAIGDSWSDTRELVVWDIATAQIVQSLPIAGDDFGTSLAFSPDGSLLAVGSDDGMIYIWDTATFQLLVTLSGHRGSVERLAFSNDGRILASAGSDGTVRLWGMSR